jgi:hypothetical protein
VDENVIAASWEALADAYTYGLLRAERGAGTHRREVEPLG